MSFDAVMGKNAKAYYNSASFSIPTWVEITRAQDVSVTLGKNMGNITARDVDWELKGAGLKTASVEFGYLHKQGTDTVFDALLDSYISDTPVDMAFMDGAIATSANQGLRAYFIASGMDQGQELEEGLGYTFTVEPTREDDSGTLRNPQWYEVP